jgi:hypothetical protein
MFKLCCSCAEFKEQKSDVMSIALRIKRLRPSLKVIRGNDTVIGAQLGCARARTAENAAWASRYIILSMRLQKYVFVVGTTLKALAVLLAGAHFWLLQQGQLCCSLVFCKVKNLHWLSCK